MKRLLTITLLGLLLAGCSAGPPRGFEQFPLNQRQRDAAMKALLGGEQYLEYVLITDTTEAAEWLRQFWAGHDPTPTTVENEFEEEHRRRLYHAIYIFGSSSRGGPPWDERGEVYIRYGEPSERRILSHGLDDDLSTRTERDRTRKRTFGGDAIDGQMVDGRAPTEIWTYYKYNESFQFEDQRGFGYFEMVPVSDPLLRRQDVAEFFTAKLSALDLQPAIYYHEYGRDLIDYALDVVRFHVGDNQWKVDVNLGYPLSELGRGPDSIAISLRRTIVIRDNDLREIYSEVGIINRRVDSLRSLNRLMVEQKILDLESGRYQLAVTIEDLFAGKSGTYTKDIHLPKYVVSEMHEISDIELASFVWTIYEPGAPFVKGNRMVMPLPSRAYLPDQELTFYYEVYNLLHDESGTTRYTVSYEILETAGDSKLRYNEPGMFSSSERDVKQFGSIDLSKIPAGDYLLSITVSDLVGNHEKTTITRFRKVG